MLYFICSITAFCLGLIVYKIGDIIGRKIWNKKHNEQYGKALQYQGYSAMPHSERANAVFLGDSITELLPVGELFENKAFYNRGISGDTTYGVLERLESNVFPLNPRKVFLLIGTNDIAHNIDIDKIFENIKTIIDRLKKQIPDVDIFLEAIYPINNHIRNNKKYDIARINALNQKLQKYAYETDLTYLTINEALTDDQGEFDKRYTYDGLHPNYAGYIVITDIIKKYL